MNIQIQWESGEVAMIDREKVIKGLETCYCPPSKCEDCPYNDIEENCNDTLCSDALALLKEQEAVIPDTNGYEWVCGSCKYPVELERKTSPQTWFHSTLYSYCPNCGKKVKWE